MPNHSVIGLFTQAIKGPDTLSSKILKLSAALGETFWLLPGAIVSAGIMLALVLIRVDQAGLVPKAWIASYWLYSGGGTGARTLLGAVASSTIGVAGTVFSITIAALSLAAGQMGPRLLRNFTRDRGNQATLGVFLGTFAYALMVLRTVRTASDGHAFVPHLSLTVGILLAFVSVGMLVYFVGHMAGRINVYTVIDLVSGDVRRAIGRLMREEPDPQVPDPNFWQEAVPVNDARRGYLQQLDTEGLATWANRNGTCLRLLVRPGDYVFPGSAIAVMTPNIEGAEAAIRDATTIGAQQISSADLDFAVRQLVEVAVRALSPSINAPMTAISVLDRLGAALCDAVPLHFASGVTIREGRAVLVVPQINYSGLTDLMFHMIRQNTRGAASVAIRHLEVLGAVAACERRPSRQRDLRRHADLVIDDARRDVQNDADLADIEDRYLRCIAALNDGNAVWRLHEA